MQPSTALANHLRWAGAINILTTMVACVGPLLLLQLLIALLLLPWFG